METAWLLGVAVFSGAIMQRLTGMGFSLVAAPFLVLIMGPVAGVTMVNFCSAAASACVLAVVIKHVDWKRYLVLAPSALLGILPGVAIVAIVPSAWLQIGIGTVVVASLTLSLCLRSTKPEAGLGALITAGATSGIMSATAGIGGPAISVYAVAARWEQRSFAATMQPYFLTTGAAAIAAKMLLDPAAMPGLPLWTWGVAAAAIVSGLVAGELLAKRMPLAWARRLVIFLAYAGALAATLRGMAEL
ncbi:sulfite exporter TauE/SafE family protein [Specibacter sp. NPDC078709]|uniref:sulfite exporter TauE/SafE family protein n=1 Tax=Specibacter sp. NPDC078709 TaxID=3154364 RepID=UPI003412D384